MAEPPLRKIAWAPNQAEAELIQGLLREQGIPSVERRAPDVPDFLAAGPRDIYVPESAAERARELLGDVAPQTNGAGVTDPQAVAVRSQGVRALRLLVFGILALLIAAAIIERA